MDFREALFLFLFYAKKYIFNKTNIKIFLKIGRLFSCRNEEVETKRKVYDL